MKLKDGMTFTEWHKDRLGRAKRSAVPPAVREILGEAPVLKGEDKQWYEETRAKFAAVLNPEDCIVWLHVDEYSYQTAEMLRLRRVKAGLIEMSCINLVLEMVVRYVEQGQLKLRPGASADQIARLYLPSKSIQAWLEEDIGLSYDTVLATVYSECHHELMLLDRSETSAQAKRNMALREIEFYRGVAARRLREVTRQMMSDTALTSVPGIVAPVSENDNEAVGS
jgi:hypothetical protein